MDGHLIKKDNIRLKRCGETGWTCPPLFLSERLIKVVRQIKSNLCFKNSFLTCRYVSDKLKTKPVPSNRLNFC
jgi:hypothetical protein